MIFDKLIKLIDYLDEEGREFFAIGFSSFLGEILSSDPFMLGMLGAEFDLRAFQEHMGEGVSQSLYMCAVEFFLSNEYPGDDGPWNAIDFFLKKRGFFLSFEDKTYLKGLRNSYMSLYEVTDIKLNQSLTLRNLLEENQSSIIVKERLATHSLCQWDVLGARIVKTPQGNLLAGGVLVLSREAVKEAQETIKGIMQVMMHKRSLDLLKGTTADPVLMVKKMWAKEIAESWFREQMQAQQEPTLLNYDGDKLDYYTIESPLKVPQREVVKKLNALPELQPLDIGKGIHAWIWPLEEKKNTSRQQKPRQRERKAHIIDTQFSDEGGMICRLFAELKIKGKTLIIDVNSEQRANIAEDFFQTHLASLIGEPIRIHHDLKKRSKEKEDDTEELKTGLSLEEEEALKKQLSDQHYKEWLDSPLSYLKGKTPRQAVKTKEGLQEVTEVLKDMINTDLRAVKQGSRVTPYNFDWIFTELGIEKCAL